MLQYSFRNDRPCFYCHKYYPYYIIKVAEPLSDHIYMCIKCFNDILYDKSYVSETLVLFSQFYFPISVGRCISHLAISMNKMHGYNEIMWRPMCRSYKLITTLNNYEVRTISTLDITTGVFKEVLKKLSIPEAKYDIVFLW